ncbi:MAG: mechanosensitive ion channel family protein [Deltaproteobacteria bacterium]|nr:mechanosensitive ion channel family protein [Deltaproteobacteria bacterium]
MKSLIDRILTEPLKEFFRQVIAFLPNLLSSLLILLFGFVAGWILKKSVVRLLDMLNTNKLCGKVGLTQGLERVGIKESPTLVLGRVVYWMVVIIFIIIALYTLRIPTVEELLGRLLLYLPNLFIAGLLIAAGYILGNFFGRATLIAAVNAGIAFSSLLANGVKTVIVLLASVMALEQLGIGQGTVIVAFTILLGGIVLSLALAFGLGGKDIAKEFLEKRFKGKVEEKDDLTHV